MKLFQPIYNVSFSFISYLDFSFCWINLLVLNKIIRLASVDNIGSKWHMIASSLPGLNQINVKLRIWVGMTAIFLVGVSTVVNVTLETVIFKLSPCGLRKVKMYVNYCKSNFVFLIKMSFDSLIFDIGIYIRC